MAQPDFSRCEFRFSQQWSLWWGGGGFRGGRGGTLAESKIKYGPGQGEGERGVPLREKGGGDRGRDSTTDRQGAGGGGLRSVPSMRPLAQQALRMTVQWAPGGGECLALSVLLPASLQGITQGQTTHYGCATVRGCAPRVYILLPEGRGGAGGNCADPHGQSRVIRSAGVRGCACACVCVGLSRECPFFLGGGVRPGEAGRALSESGIRAIQCYDCPTAQCGSGHDTAGGRAKLETRRCSRNCPARSVHFWRSLFWGFRQTIACECEPKGPMLKKGHKMQWVCPGWGFSRLAALRT